MHTTARPIVRGAEALLVAVALSLAGCVPPPAVTPQAPVRAVFTPATYAALPGWRDDLIATAWPAFRVGCKALVVRARTQALWQRACAAAEDVDANDTQAVRRFFEQNFTPYRITGSDGSDRGLVTGYYEPLLHGSHTRSIEYPQPLYATPDDLLIVDLADLYPELKGRRVRGRLDGRRVVPYWPRADIDAGKADTDGKALVYVSSAVDAFFLQIQGSGRVALDDGSTMRVGYADQNGQPFRSVARVLIDRGELTIEQASMQGIREWGREHPEQLPALLDENPSYVFFREVPPPAPGSIEAAIDGPIGSLGVPLLAGRAIAVDPRSIPLGAPVFLATTQPLSDAPLQRLVMAQDTGGAIRGPIRADFFWGFGDDAGREAGKMREQGAMWLLWPDGAPLPNSTGAS
ncbi:MAG TPA: murein transglycosylase A [Casimicrobiaceae bacterium]|nr:murein transglycosylase A [Casimicrobiaceae bacterium]